MPSRVIIYVIVIVILGCLNDKKQTRFIIVLTRREFSHACTLLMLLLILCLFKKIYQWLKPQQDRNHVYERHQLLFLSGPALLGWNPSCHMYNFTVSGHNVMKLINEEAPMRHLGYSPVPGFLIFTVSFPFSFLTTRHSWAANKEKKKKNVQRGGVYS